MAMTLRLTPEDESALAVIVEMDGLSKQEATIRAIREAAERRGHRAKVVEASALLRERYAETLERLGK